MARLRSSKLWQAIRGKAQSQAQPAMKAPHLPIEILEMIFAHLDIFALLRCRTVCRLWQHYIPGTSHSIRSLLFLPSSQPADQLGHFSPDTHPPSLGYVVTFANDFLDTRAPQHAGEYTVRAHSRMQEDAYETATDLYKYNPLLFSPMSQSRLRRCKRTWTTTATAEEITTTPPFWMSMYATIPPARMMRLSFEFPGTRLVCEEAWVQKHNISDVEVWDPRGVTVGRVLSVMCGAIWWPDMMLSRTGGGRRLLEVRVVAREEGG